MGSLPAVGLVVGFLAAGEGRWDSLPGREGLWGPGAGYFDSAAWTGLSSGANVFLTHVLLTALALGEGPSPVGATGLEGRSPASSQAGQPEILPKIPRRLPTALLAGAMPPQPATPGAFLPVRLVDLLARPASRDHQRNLILSYWDLSAAVATVSFRKQELTWLQSLRVALADQQAYQAALSEAAAALQEAEAALAQAQQTLAHKAGWDPKTVRPWPLDKPHIGTYSTMLKSLFAGRSVPRELLLIDRCLPWWQKAIDRRAQAVYAAEDALEALQEAYQQGRTDLRTLLWAYAQWQEQHTAFLEATVAYNAQIADFALTVAAPAVYGPALVRMLILVEGGSQGAPPAGNRTGDVRRAFGDPSYGTGSGVTPATYEEPAFRQDMPGGRLEPIPLGEAEPLIRREKPEPTPAGPVPGTPGSAGSPFHTPPSGGTNEPTLAPPRPSSAVAPPLVPLTPERVPSASGPGSGPERGSGTGSESEPGRTPASQPGTGSASTPASSGAGESAKPTASQEPSLPEPEGPLAGDKPVVRQAQRPPDRSAWSEETVALYPGLAQASPSAQAENLARSFHGPTEPKGTVRQEKLLGCLQRVGLNKRWELLEAYWLLWQQRAETIALEQQKANLDKLGTAMLQQPASLLRAEERLLWRIVLLATEAEQMEAQIRLLQREEKLARLLGLGLEGNLIPATLPYTGPYNLRLETLDKNVRNIWAVRRAAGLVPLLYADLQQRAKAVVQADQYRTELFQQYSRGQRPLYDLLAAHEQQKQATFDFLQTLTDYNQAIADYVVLVVSADLPAEEFLRTLVKEP